MSDQASPTVTIFTQDECNFVWYYLSQNSISQLQTFIIDEYVLRGSVNFGSYFRFSLSLQTFSSTKTPNILVQFQSTKSHYILVQFQSHLKVHLIATLNSFPSLLRPRDPLCCVYNCIIVKLAVHTFWMQLVSKIQISYAYS